MAEIHFPNPSPIFPCFCLPSSNAKLNKKRLISKAKTLDVLITSIKYLQYDYTATFDELSASKDLSCLFLQGEYQIISMEG